MAQRSSEYLPRYYSQKVGIVAPAPTNFGAEAEAYDRLGRGAVATAKGAIDVLGAYAAVKQERDARDTDTSIGAIFRERQLQVYTGIKGRDADGLMENEQAWSAEQREKAIQNSNLPPQQAAALWDRRATSYLDNITNYQLREMAEADKQSKIAAVVDRQDNLVISQPGDFRAYAEYSAFVAQTYPKDSEMAIKAREKGLDVLIDSWAASNPEGTVNWFNKNKEELKQVMGREFPGISGAMERVERRLESAAARSQANLLRQERVALKQQAATNKQWQSEAITKILSDDSYDINKAIQEGAAMGIDGSTLLSVQKIAENREKVSVGKVSGALRTQYLGKATTEGLTETEEIELMKQLSNGTITPSHYSNIMSASDRSKKAGEAGIKDVRRLAMTHLKTAIAPRGGMDSVNQAAESEYELSAAQLDTYVNSLKSPAERVQALNINDPTSYVSRLIEAKTTGVTAVDRMRRSYSNAPVQFSGQAADMPEGVPTQTPAQRGVPLKDFLNKKREAIGE